MKKSILALAAAAALVAGTLAVPHPAEARCHSCGVAAAVIGGVAAGAIIGGAIANSDHHHYHHRYYDHDRYYRYRPVRGYVAYDGYYARGPVACPGGYWARRRIYNRWGRFIGWSRPHYFCP